MKKPALLTRNVGEQPYDPMVAVLGTYCVQLARQIPRIMSIHLEWDAESENAAIAIVFRDHPMMVVIEMPEEWSAMCVSDLTLVNVKEFYNRVFDAAADAERELLGACDE